jgi:hypothetical protein
MKQFDYYEFTGILVPGATAVASTVVLFPQFLKLEFLRDLSGIGGAGLFVIVAYLFGHLIQAIGDLFENIWWKMNGGMPTDWFLKKPRRLLAEQQVRTMYAALQKHSFIKASQIKKLKIEEWRALTREIYTAVRNAGLSYRVDVFNGDYGLNRGIAACSLVVFVIATIKVQDNHDLVVLATVACTGLILATYRMHRFGQHYARELFVQFLHLSKHQTKKQGK